MQRSRRTLVATGLSVAGRQLSACIQQSAETDGATSEPATVEHIEGSEVRRLALTAKEAERLGIRTKPGQWRHLGVCQPRALGLRP